jgi:hypothetical protein
VVSKFPDGWRKISPLPGAGCLRPRLLRMMEVLE